MNDIVVTPAISVVVATYEWPAALDIVLRALSEQRGQAFETVVAEDGSDTDTASVCERWRTRLDLRHVRQQHEGFRKARLLNRAVLSTSGEYLVFLDGDCIPRHGFVDAVRRAAMPRWFIASKRVHLSPRMSEGVLSDATPVWRWSGVRWLLTAPRELVTSPHRQANRPGALIPLRDRTWPWRSNPREFRPPYNGYGFAFGMFRADFERANGFDMRLGGWDAEDTDLAHRLRRTGLRCRWPGPDATVLHLWHPLRKQGARRGVTSLDAIEAEDGLRELAAELGTP